MAEGTSFWGHTGLQQGFGKVDGKPINARRKSPNDS